MKRSELGRDSKMNSNQALGFQVLASNVLTGADGAGFMVILH